MKSWIPLTYVVLVLYITRFSHNDILQGDKWNNIFFRVPRLSQWSMVQERAKKNKEEK